VKKLNHKILDFLRKIMSVIDLSQFWVNIGGECPYLEIDLNEVKKRIYLVLKDYFDTPSTDIMKKVASMTFQTKDYYELLGTTYFLEDNQEIMPLTFSSDKVLKVKYDSRHKVNLDELLIKYSTEDEGEFYTYNNKKLNKLNGLAKNSVLYLYEDTYYLVVIYINLNYPELITCLFETYYKEIIEGVLFDEYNNLKKKIGVPMFKNWFMKTFVNLLECNIFNTMSKEDTIQDDIEKQHLKELNEGDNAISSNTNNQEKKIIVNPDAIRTITETERENLYNKFIYSILV